MAINTIELAKIYQEQLDNIAIHEAKTGWMEANAGQVIYNGGKEVKIPKMSLDGLGNYDHDNGYIQGSVTFEYETKSMTQDRGRKFVLDATAVDETNFSLTAGTITSEFQRTKVIPEIDAYRISKLATTAIATGNAEYGFTPSSQNTLAKIKEGIKAIRENGFDGELVCHINYDALTDLELQMAGKLSAITFSVNGVDTRVNGVDDVPLIATPKNRMYSAITLNDGKTSGQTLGGYEKASTGLDVNFIIVARNVPIAVSKQDIMRIFDPITNQNANAWLVDYRRYHDLWVKDNAAGGIFVNIKDARP